MQKRRFRRAYSDGSPEGEVTLEGELLRVAFSYSPERVAEIKRIPRARFVKDQRCWTVPLSQLTALQSLSSFSPDRITYRVHPDDVSATPAERIAQREQALAALRSNPFRVPESVIAKLPLDCVIRLSAKQAGLRAFPRFGSRAERVLTTLPGAYLVRTEQAWSVPVSQLTTLLKTLRDERLSFAVEERTGDRLSETAELRAQILSDRRSADAESLRRCLLVPFVERGLDPDGYEHGYGFTLIGADSTLLKQLFPEGKSFPERRKMAGHFNESVLLRIISRARRTNTQLALTEDVKTHLKHKERELSSSLPQGGAFNEAYLGLVSLPQCWIGEEPGLAGLLVERDVALQEIDRYPEHPLTGYQRELHPALSDRYFYQLGESILLDRYEALGAYLRAKGEAVLPESAGFQRLRGELIRRQALLERREFFQKSQDLELDTGRFSAPDSAERLFPHQRVAVGWLLENERAFLGDDMGLGKTLSVLSAFDVLAHEGRCDFLLVVCPNSLTRNWARECLQWFPRRHLAVLSHEKADKIRVLKQLARGDLRPDGLVLNYETVRLPYVLPELQRLLATKRAVLCLDESQRVKNPSSKTFQALVQLVPSAARRVLLSGTPTPKDISDIWSQMYLLDGGARFGENFYQWLGSIAELGNEYSEYAVKRLKPHALRETIARVHEILLRRRKEEVVDLPAKTFTVRDIELTGEQLERYEEICHGLLLRVTSLSGRTFVREIESVLEEYLRAVQVGSNPRLIDEQWQGEPAKFKELDLIVSEVVGERDEKIVIWTNYLKNVSELVARYAQYGAAPFSGDVSTADRDRTVREFQTGEALKVLVAVPAAGGVGITLTAAQTAVYVEKTWNAEHWLQSIDRIHRIGQTGTVNVISLSASPVDELIDRNLKRKQRMLAQVLGDKQRQVDAELEPIGQQELPSRQELIEALQTQGYQGRKKG